MIRARCVCSFCLIPCSTLKAILCTTTYNNIYIEIENLFHGKSISSTTKRLMAQSCVIIISLQWYGVKMPCDPTRSTNRLPFYFIIIFESRKSMAQNEWTFFLSPLKIESNNIIIMSRPMWLNANHPFDLTIHWKKCPPKYSLNTTVQLFTGHTKTMKCYGF